VTTSPKSDRYVRLQQQVSRTLYEVDPDEIGISIDAPLDEYDDIALRLVPRLLAAESSYELRERLAEVFAARVDELSQPLWKLVSEYRAADAGR
jgi:hypothetical protein